MPTVTDWLMVGITLVYVIATIFICLANIKSAKASKEQLEESKKEHEETIRIGVMPFLQFEAYPYEDFDFELDFPLFQHSECDRTFSKIMRLINIGNGAATNLTYTWQNSSRSIYIADAFRVNALKANGEYKINLVFDCSKAHINSSEYYDLILHFDDMRGYAYNQRMIFTFYTDGESCRIADIATDTPEYTGVRENA